MFIITALQKFEILIYHFTYVKGMPKKIGFILVFCPQNMFCTWPIGLECFWHTYSHWDSFESSRREPILGKTKLGGKKKKHKSQVLQNPSVAQLWNLLVEANNFPTGVFTTWTLFLHHEIWMIWSLLPQNCALAHWSFSCPHSVIICESWLSFSLHTIPNQSQFLALTLFNCSSADFATTKPTWSPKNIVFSVTRRSRSDVGHWLTYSLTKR